MVRICPILPCATHPRIFPLPTPQRANKRRFSSRLVLAHAGLIKQMTGFAPLLLLDEVVAHLDPTRRAALYDALSSLGAQVWMTGADPAAFGDIVGRANVFVVRNGAVEPAPHCGSKTSTSRFVNRNKIKSSIIGTITGACAFTLT